MLGVCLFGAGRIGAIHAGNIARHPGAGLRWVVDVNRQAANALAGRYGARSGSDVGAALGDPDVRAVVIASSTNTHVDLILAAAHAGKAIFCEKPIDLDLARVDRCIAEVAPLGVSVFVGFNRRFDPSFAALHAEIRKGAIGRVEQVVITSRDPGPPPLDYVKVSGGLFRDMMIHDFDTARWLLGAEPVEVSAQASCVVDPAIGQVGDVDSAMVTLKTADGVLCQISNSRRAVYGYDQRIEVLGERGMLQAGNRTTTAVSRWGADGVVTDKPLYFFLERYGDAYRAEMDHFLGAVAEGTPLALGARDGRAALALAEAALASLASGRVEKVTR